MVDYSQWIQEQRLAMEGENIVEIDTRTVPFTLPLWTESYDDDLAISVGRLYTFNATANEWDAQPLASDRGPVRLTILPNRTVDLVGRWSEDYTLHVNSLRVFWNGDKPSAPTKCVRYHGRLRFARYFSDIPDFVGRVVSIERYPSYEIPFEDQSPLSVQSVKNDGLYCLMVELGVLTEQ